MQTQYIIHADCELSDQLFELVDVVQLQQDVYRFDMFSDILSQLY